MKKIFIAAFLLPFSLLGSVYLHTFNDDLTTSVHECPIASQASGWTSPDFTNMVFSIYFNNFNGMYYGRRGFLAPLGTITIPTNGPSYSVDYQIYVGSSTYANPLFFPRVASLYYTAFSLYNSGYRSTGLKVVYEASPVVYLNFNFSMIVSDVLSSTNNLYQSIVLSSLGSLNTSVNNINIDLSNFQNLYKTQNPLSGVSMSNIVQTAFDNSLISGPLYDRWQDQINEFSNPFYDNYPDDRALAYNNILKSLDSLASVEGLMQGINNAALRDSQNFQNAASKLGNSFNGSVDASVNDFKRLSTNWQEGVKKDLQDWRNDVTNRLAHMFDDNIPIDGGNSTPVYVSGQNGGPVSVAGVVRIDQQIPVGVTISAPITIDPTQFNQFSSGWESIVQAVSDFHDYFTSWASNGDIGFGWVRYYSMMYDFSQNTLTNQLAQISLLSSLTNLFTIYADNFTNNVIFSISNALAGLTSVSNDYMLLSDYAHYINSHGLSDLIDIMDDDTYSALKDELFGISSLDQADSYGRWWRYFTGLETINANSNYKLANLFIGHEKTLNDLKDSSGADSLIDKFQQLFELIPSPTDIMDKTGNLTNSIDRSGFASLLDQSSSMSNYFNRVEMFFNRGSSLPANISINLGFGNKPGLNNAQPIVLPLDKYRGVMDLLHYGIAFSYCIVNLILLPKFLLILIHLFDRVWKGYDKKLSDAVQA